LAEIYDVSPMTISGPAAEAKAQAKFRPSNEQSVESPFKSKVDNVWLSTGQYLAEQMCARKASRDDTALPSNYRQSPKWKDHFEHQERQATRLLKRYEKDALFRALKMKEGKKVYSLGASWVDGLVLAEQERLDIQKKAAEVKAQAEPVSEPCSEPAAREPPRPVFAPEKTLLSKLRGL
jgi:hypothetical protein